MYNDEVDLTASARKWNKKMAEKLEKLNSDCNMTAGLEAKAFTSSWCTSHVALQY